MSTYMCGLPMLEMHMRVQSPSLSHGVVEMLVPRQPNDAPAQVMALELLWEVVGSEHPSFLLLFSALHADITGDGSLSAPAAMGTLALTGPFSKETWL